MYLTCNHNWEFPSAGGQSVFLLEAAGCWIQTTNPSVSESSNNICQVTSQQFSLTFVFEMDFFLRKKKKKKLSGGSSRRNALRVRALNIFMRISCAVIRGSTFWCSHHLISPSYCCYQTLKSCSFTAFSCHFTASLTHSTSPRTVFPRSQSQNVTQLQSPVPSAPRGSCSRSHPGSYSQREVAAFPSKNMSQLEIYV